MAKKRSTKRVVANPLLPTVQVELPTVTNAATVANGLSDALLSGSNPHGFGSQLSQADTLFLNNRWYLISNMRQLLSQMYAENGLVQTVIDVPVDDALRGGVDITTKQLNEAQVLQLQTYMEEEGDLLTLGYGLKWNRLFGGGGVLIITDQDPTTPLDIEAIDKDTPVEFRDVDLWELFYSRANVADDYDTQIDGADFDVGYFDYYGKKVHRSRVELMKGVRAPSFVRPRLRGWGMSVMEAFVRSINQYLKANNLTFEVLDEFKIDVFKIKGLAQTLLAANGAEKIRQRVQLANQEKNFNHALTMDAEDDFDHKELSFAGIAEVMAGIRMQVASDLRMPLTKVFGISSAGFSSGEDDIENYNAMIESSIRSRAKYHLLTMVKIRCQQLFGIVPEDLALAWKPLRVLGAEQEENVKSQQFSRVLSAKQAGEITTKEFREAVNKAKLMPMLLDTSVDDLPGKEETEDGKTVAAPKAPESTLAAPQAKNSLPDLSTRNIVTVGITCGDYILTGQRKDNGKWTNPGGHIDGGEDPQSAACREVLEESGIYITPEDLRRIGAPQKLKSQRVGGKDFVLHSYIAEVADRVMPKTTNDPDQEVGEWRWVKINPNTQELLPSARHAYNDSVLEYLFKKGTFR